MEITFKKKIEIVGPLVTVTMTHDAGPEELEITIDRVTHAKTLNGKKVFDLDVLAAMEEFEFGVVDWRHKLATTSEGDERPYMVGRKEFDTFEQVIDYAWNEHKIDCFCDMPETRADEDEACRKLDHIIRGYTP